MKAIFPLLFLTCLSFSAFGQSDTISSSNIEFNLYIPLSHSERIEKEKHKSASATLFNTNTVFLKNKLFHYDPKELWETYADGLHTQIEAGHNLSDADEIVQSVRGASYTWNKHYYNSFPIHSLARPGASLHQIQMHSNDFFLDDLNLDFRFYSNYKSKKQGFVGVNTTFGGLGERVPFANWFVNEVMSHSSAQDRQIKPFDYRRRTSYLINTTYQNHFEKGALSHVFFQSKQGLRKHLNFGLEGLENDFDERFSSFLGDMTWRMKNENSSISEIQTLISARERDALFAEYNWNANETAKESHIAFSAFAKQTTNRLHHRFGLNFSTRNQSLHQDTIYKNVVDLDGEGFQIHQVNGRFNELQLHSVGSFRLKADQYIKWESRFQGLNYSAAQKQGVYLSYFDNIDTTFIPLNAYQPESSSFWTWMPDQEVSWQLKSDVDSKIKWSIEPKLHYSAVASPNVAIHGLSLDFEADATWKLGEKTWMSLELGKTSFAYNYDLVRLLETNYLSGDINYWKDNGNQHFEANELGSVYDNTYRIEHNDLRMTKLYYFKLPIKHQSKKHAFVFSPQFRSYQDTWRVRYKGKASDYGYFQSAEHTDHQIFHLTSNPNYIIENTPKAIQENNEGKGALFNQPFFAGVTTKYAFENSKIYTSLSISAYMTVFAGTLGNGVWNNSVGSFDLSSGNPNTELNTEGRSHSDRAFIVRALFNKKVSERFSYGITVKYKDGEPFSNFSTQLSSNGNGENQVAIWNEAGPADNPFTAIFNKREDAYYSVDLRARYGLPLKTNKKLEFTAVLYNVLDFGLEIAEYNFRPFTDNPASANYYDNNSRAALEIQNPRTLEVGIQYQF
ncbi:MAG: hypothetical protein ACPG4W_06095 [Flavobacteriales bacterium]